MTSFLRRKCTPRMEGGWFAARPSGIENIYKIYAKSFKAQERLAAIQAEAQAIVSATRTQGC